ncbi:hypothetical protein SCBWM1_gp120 [Synechococcus phage S-CBWM1]|uniref:Uncharacterized protein n=1 Tax=Synechococcus phage S-CBWM1 TaxID=2053653 RepID=A0A3G1L3P1_9CAUD|nr:hypothetical protein HOU61_gp077 [Synechococcus phage S-CBWM1]ATW62804.1 hypothetical protein SCBWM1_gp120 [Synechococcus phage S-CBWM1]
MEEIYYSFKLQQEFSASQIRAQVGLPDSCNSEDFVRFGFFPLKDPMINSWVFFNAPKVYRLSSDEMFALSSFSKEEKSVDMVRSRAAQALVEKASKEILSLVKSDLTGVVFTLLCNSSGFEELSTGSHILGEVENYKSSLNRVKLAESRQEIQEILILHELFSIPTESV